MRTICTLVTLCVFAQVSPSYSQDPSSVQNRATENGTRETQWQETAAPVVSGSGRSLLPEQAMRGNPLAYVAYRENRERFVQQRETLATESQRLQEKIEARKRVLDELAVERSKLLQLADMELGESPSTLRSFTRSLETAIASTLNPVSTLISLAANRDAVPANSVMRFFVNLGQAISPYAAGNSAFLNIVLPLMLVLSFLIIRKQFPEFYQRWRMHLQRLTLGLVLLLPLSSFAQLQNLTRDSGAADLEQILMEADEVLGLTRIERYIRQLSASEIAGRRVRLTKLDLADSPIPHFESVVVGTGEYHATLAALYYAAGNPVAAAKQLEALAQPATRYATKTGDPKRFEALIAGAALYLLRNDRAELAEQIVRLHVGDLRSNTSLESLYPELYRNALPAVANELVNSFLEEAAGFSQPTEYLSTFSQNGSVALATASLDKALQHEESFVSSGKISDIGLMQSTTGDTPGAMANAQQSYADLSEVFTLADELNAAGRTDESSQLLERAITQAREQASSTVAGKSLPTIAALKYMSYESFRRGLYKAAEKSALAAIKPLSVAERRALIMPVPPDAVEPVRVPEPEKLVAPLYFGLLYEKQGRPQAARARFETEGRLVLANLVESNGLYEPNMMNHLSLLGSVLDTEKDAATLSLLDALLVRLEQDAIAQLRTSSLPEIENGRSLLAQTEEQISSAQAEIRALRKQIDARQTSGGGEGLSAPLLLLRSLSLLAVAGLYCLGITIVALRFALGRMTYRISAFWWKAVESLGWIWVLSVFSAPLGIGTIVIAQFFLLNHSRKESAPEVVQGADIRTNKVRQPLKQDRRDAQWSNVLQMLRESKDTKIAR